MMRIKSAFSLVSRGRDEAAERPTHAPLPQPKLNTGSEEPVMTVIRPAGRPAEEASPPTTEVEGLVRREVASNRRPQRPDQGGEMIATQVNSLIQRVSITSVNEIDKLISELQSVRDFLHHESQRVQREISGYTQLSEAALKSTRIITESMSQWKNTGDNNRAERI